MLSFFGIRRNIVVFILMMPSLSALKNIAVVGFLSHQSLLINGRFLIQIFCIQSILLFPRYNLNLWQYFKLADPSTYQDIPSPFLTDVPFPINPFLLHSFLSPIFPSFSSPTKLLRPPTVSLVARPGPTARRACKGWVVICSTLADCRGSFARERRRLRFL